MSKYSSSGSLGTKDENSGLETANEGIGALDPEIKASPVGVVVVTASVMKDGVLPDSDNMVAAKFEQS